MKKRLNISGINKVITYLGEDKFAAQNISGVGDLLLGNFSENDVAKIGGIGVAVEHIGAGLHKVYHITEEDIENLEAGEKIVEPQSTETPEEKNPKELQNLAEELVPVLTQIFPTKEEVNAALNDLKAQMVDPEEMMNNLKIQMKNIKKQSRDSDEIG